MKSLSGSALVCAHIHALLRLSVCPGRAHAHTHTPPRAVSFTGARDPRRVEGFIRQREEATRHSDSNTSDHKQQDSEAESTSTNRRPRKASSVRSCPFSRFHWNTEAALEEVGSKLSGVWSESLCAVALVEVKCTETWTSRTRFDPIPAFPRKTLGLSDGDSLLTR